MELPHNNEAEMAVLGSILIDKDMAFLAYPLLRTEFFFKDEHRTIYDAVQSLVSTGKPVDVVTLSNKLTEGGRLQMVGGTDYLTTLMQSSPTSLYAEEYARIVRDYYKLRTMVLAATKILNSAQNASIQNVNKVLDSFSELLYGLSKKFRASIQRKRPHEEYWEEFERRYNNPGTVDISTGYQEIDAVINGFRSGDLVVVAGRPSMGKTSLIYGSVLSLAGSGVPNLLFPYEMSRLQTSQRFVSMQSGVNLSKIMTTVGLTEKEMEAQSKAVSLINSSTMYIDSNVFGDIYYLTSAIRRYVNQFGIKVVFIDYLQLIPVHTDDLTNEYGMITRTLKILARSLDITIVLLSQLNRGPESRAEGKPKMSDLRQSGRIEEDADIVILIHRNLDGSPNDAEIIIAKNRNGPRGSISLFFDEELTKFIGR